MRNHHQHYLNGLIRDPDICSWLWGACIHQQDEADLCRMLVAREPVASGRGRWKTGLWNILFNIQNYYASKSPDNRAADTST